MGRGPERGIIRVGVVARRIAFRSECGTYHCHNCLEVAMHARLLAPSKDHTTKRKDCDDVPELKLLPWL